MMKPVVLDYEEFLTRQNEYLGYCTACGAEHDGIEPDARAYTCEVCEAKQVYGLQELLFMGLVINPTEEKQ